MLFRLKIIIIAFLTFYSTYAWSAQDISILILPFEVNAQDDLQYLHQDLPQMLGKDLQEKGFDIIPRQKMQALLQEQGVEYLDTTIVRDLALLGGAQYSLYGSFSQVGDSISIDARLVEAYGLRSPKPIFVVKKGLINILPALQELAEKVKQELQLKERIAEVKVEGNRILEKEVILTRLNLVKGDLFDLDKLDQELKRLYSLGYFEDIVIHLDESPQGKVVTFEIKEKPLIKGVSVLGAEELDQDDILEAMSSKAGSVINPKVLSEDMARIREMYRKKGYYKAEVDYKLEQIDPRQARLDIVIKEGNKLYIKDIKIEGAKQLDEDDLKDELALSEKGFFSWLTDSGVLKKELLDRDGAALEAYYTNRGFMDAKVGQPEVKFKDDGIYITFKVDEGRRFKAGKVDFSGDMISSPEELLAVTEMDDLNSSGEFFDRSVLRKDVQALADHYTNYGYAFAEADVSLRRNDEDGSIDVTYSLDKGGKVYIRRVIISGNTKTRDNVIRREMRLSDGDLFSGSKLRRSNQRLNKMDFFESVNIDTVPTSDRDSLDLLVKVKEKTTGMLSAGAGYSSLEKFFVTAQVKERNLFGKAYQLGLQGTFGGTTTTYDLTFWNPHLNDSKLGMGAEAYLSLKDYSDYDKKAVGGSVKLGYPLGEYTNIYGRYRLEQYFIRDVDDDASDYIKEIEGENWGSALYLSATRDTTDRRLNPSKGTINTLSVEYSGGLIGGDDNFIKYIADSSYYQPLFWSTVFHLHGQFGYIMKNSDKDIPIFERFYLGGMSSVRGYDARKISPRDEDSEDRERIGGSKEFFTNVEYLFPLSKEFGLIGLVFFDAGNTWDDNEKMDFDLYKSVGCGLRWYSPLGPLRLEYGYPLDELEDSSSGGKVEFSIGQFF